VATVPAGELAVAGVTAGDPGVAADPASSEQALRPDDAARLRASRATARRTM
jgi:hypothetical protein